MPKNQVIYNQVGLFVGPSPSSGFHWITSDGTLNSSGRSAPDNYNLVFPLHRVNNASFSIQPERQNISHMGNLGTISRPILDNTTINLNFNYYLMGLINEARLGFHVNTNSGDPVFGKPLYGTGRVCPILGFYSRDYTRPEYDTFDWPMEYRDVRNIFIAEAKDSLDFNVQTGTFYNRDDYKKDVYIYGFGDCYLNSYNCSIGVREFPNVSVSYSCNNLEIYDGVTGGLPSINAKTYDVYSGNTFTIPNDFQGTGTPTILLPRDISLSIRQRSDNSEDLENAFVDYADIKIQGLNFGFDLGRKPMYALGYKYPLDRSPSFPVICDLNFNCIAGDSKVGSMVSLLKNGEEYDISVTLGYQENNGELQGDAIRYDFIGAKFKNHSVGLSIESKKTVDFGFSTDINPNNTTKGFFMSGYLGLLSNSDFGISNIFY